MKPAQFANTRADGRSNVQVILDLVRDGEPGQVYPYQRFVEALNVGSNRTYAIRDAQRVIMAGHLRLLREQDRALHNLRGVGYRLAQAKEHMGLALTHKHRADNQLNRGLHLLRHVRWDELDENSRKAHQGTLLLTETLWANQQALEKRLRAVEDAIRTLKA